MNESQGKGEWLTGAPVYHVDLLADHGAIAVIHVERRILRRHVQEVGAAAVRTSLEDRLFLHGVNLPPFFSVSFGQEFLYTHITEVMLHCFASTFFCLPRLARYRFSGTGGDLGGMSERVVGRGG